MQNQYHFLYIAAADMAKMALSADKVPDKPTTPKPTVSSHYICILYTDIPSYSLGKYLHQQQVRLVSFNILYYSKHVCTNFSGLILVG